MEVLGTAAIIISSLLRYNINGKLILNKYIVLTKKNQFINGTLMGHYITDSFYFFLYRARSKVYWSKIAWAWGGGKRWSGDLRMMSQAEKYSRIFLAPPLGSRNFLQPSAPTRVKLLVSSTDQPTLTTLLTSVTRHGGLALDSWWTDLLCKKSLQDIRTLPHDHRLNRTVSKRWW